MKEMQRELLDTIQNQQETINNMVSKVGNTTNNLTNNNNFNINLFLNDKCKDAINFSDFIDRIEISHDDLENNRELGFVNGVTKILVIVLLLLLMCYQTLMQNAYHLLI